MPHALLCCLPCVSQLYGERDAADRPSAWHLGSNPTLETLSSLTRLSSLSVSEELCPCLTLAALAPLTALALLRLSVVPAGELACLSALTNLRELAFVGALDTAQRCYCVACGRCALVILYYW